MEVHDPISLHLDHPRGERSHKFPVAETRISSPVTTHVPNDKARR
jgi:hypothetical protein